MINSKTKTNELLTIKQVKNTKLFVKLITKIFVVLIYLIDNNLLILIF